MNTHFFESRASYHTYSLNMEHHHIMEMFRSVSRTCEVIFAELAEDRHDVDRNLIDIAIEARCMQARAECLVKLTTARLPSHVGKGDASK